MGPGESIHVSLGQLWLSPDRLELSYSSPERLAAGQALLSEVLGELIAWRFESAQTRRYAGAGQGRASGSTGEGG